MHQITLTMLTFAVIFSLVALLFKHKKEPVHDVILSLYGSYMALTIGATVVSAIVLIAQSGM